METEKNRSADDPNKYGQELRNFRQKLGLSQDGLAKILKMTEREVLEIENGLRPPPRKRSFYKRLLNIPGYKEPGKNRAFFRLISSAAFFYQNNPKEEENK